MVRDGLGEADGPYPFGCSSIFFREPPSQEHVGQTKLRALVKNVLGKRGATSTGA